MSERTSDSDLLLRLAGGDRQVLAELYDRHSTLLYSVAMRILDDPTEAQDLLHDLFSTLERRAGNYRAGDGRAVGWLLTITRRLALDRVRQDKRRREILRDAAPDLGQASAAGDGGLYGDEISLLRKCVATLSDEQRQALELAYFAGLTHEEISSSLETPLGTVKARIRRGLLRLKSCVEGRQ